MDNPNLYILAGPNGSGKSSIGIELINQLESNVTFFNGDQTLDDFKKRYPGLLPGDLNDKLLNHYDKVEDSILDKHESFALETNFADNWLAQEMATPNKFRSRGYSIHLIFFDTILLSDSVERVKFRVANGLHDVAFEVIKKNFETSARNFSNAFEKFDKSYILINNLKRNNKPPLLAFEWTKLNRSKTIIEEREVLLERFGKSLLHDK